MRKVKSTFIVLAILCGFLVLTSCAKEDVATVGNLHVTIVDVNGQPITGVEVLLSSNLLNQYQGVILFSGWTDDSGRVNFNDLNPEYYWYGVRAWKDFGAVMVYSGLDTYVELQLNSPVNKKK
jgi:hypothetical protein